MEKPPSTRFDAVSALKLLLKLASDGHLLFVKGTIADTLISMLLSVIAASDFNVLLALKSFLPRAPKNKGPSTKQLQRASSIPDLSLLANSGSTLEGGLALLITITDALEEESAARPSYEVHLTETLSSRSIAGASSVSWPELPVAQADSLGALYNFQLPSSSLGASGSTRTLSLAHEALPADSENDSFFSQGDLAEKWGTAEVTEVAGPQQASEIEEITDEEALPISFNAFFNDGIAETGSQVSCGSSFMDDDIERKNQLFRSAILVERQSPTSTLVALSSLFFGRC